MLKKTNTPKPQSQPKQPNPSVKRPENKDNLDSREGEEQEFKGDDTTHNRKPHSNKHPHTKK